MLLLHASPIGGSGERREPIGGLLPDNENRAAEAARPPRLVGRSAKAELRFAT